jgi:ABC-type phosphate transport system substrate-binding protein
MMRTSANRLKPTKLVCVCLLAMAALLIAGLFAVNPAHAAAQSSVNWYYSGCWRSASFEELGMSDPIGCSYANSAGYLASNTRVDGTGGEHFGLSTSDYCVSHGIGDELSHPVEEDLFGMLARPIGSYEEGDGKGNACGSWSYAGEWASYRLRCASYPTICAASEPDVKCKPEEQLCQCGYNGFLCECWNSNEACWGEYSSGLGDGEIARATCSQTEIKELAERGISCEQEEVHPSESPRWGFAIRKSALTNPCPVSCEIQRYTPLGASKDHPWAAYFGNPSLQVSETSEDRVIFSGGNAQGWAFICPVLENDPTGNIMEVCFEEWRGLNPVEWEREHARSCASPAGLGHNVDQIVTLFAPGTLFATEQAGSAESARTVEKGGVRSFAASITPANLINAVNADNQHCGRVSTTTPGDWSLIGVASGVESLGAEFQTIVGRASSVSTSYEQIPSAVAELHVSEFESEQAKLTGTINPYGAGTGYIVEYGPTSQYGQSTSEVYLGSGTKPVPISATLTSLQPATTYHYRIKARGTITPDQTFSTPVVTPQVETKPAVDLKLTSAVLVATVNPHNSVLTSCRFEYGTTTAYGSTIPCSPSPSAANYPEAVTATPTLAEHTTYHFRVVATNAAGTSPGVDETFATRPYAPEVSIQPASVGRTQATLHGNVNPEAGLVTSCSFEYGTTEAYGHTIACAANPGSGEESVPVAASLTGLSESTTYHFRIVATNNVGTSHGTDTTLKTIPKAPTTVTEGAASVQQTTATLVASVNPNAAGVTDCHFEYGSTTSYGRTAPCTPSSPGSGEAPVEVSAPVTSLVGQTVYHMRVVATNSFGSSYGEDRQFATRGVTCAGASVWGLGASTQLVAQPNVWDRQFNLSANAFACNGTQGTKQLPTVTFQSAGDGAALEMWGVNGHYPDYGLTHSFLATDEAPSYAQAREMERLRQTHEPVPVETIPVAQESLAIIVNLPTGCVAETKYKKEKRLVLNNVTLEGIFRGTITKWNEITDDGDELSGPGCNPATKIRVVVRKDQTGTTHVLKKYLNLVNSGTMSTEAGTKSWASISQGPENVYWPVAAQVLRSNGSSDVGEASTVVTTPGSIGYASLAEVRNYGEFSPGWGQGGPGTSRFWVEVQNNGLETSGKLKYEDPASNEDLEALGETNCTNTEYTNGTQAFPPASSTEPWNEVTTRTIEKKYTLCYFTYDLALQAYGAYPGTSRQQAETVENFMRFTVETKAGGGQKLIEERDYEPLPKGKVLTEAQAGAAQIKF